MTADRIVAPTPFVKPVRVPDDVECQIAEPSVARAGETGDWQFGFVVSADVDEGTPLRVLFHGGRHVKGTFSLEEVSANGPDGAVLALLETDGNEVAFACPAGGGERVTVALTNATVGILSLPSKMVLLYVSLPEEETDIPSINSEPLKRIIGACLIDVTGGALDHLRVHAPSHVDVAEPLNILVKAEDAHNNLACERPGELTVMEDDEVLEYDERMDHPEWACCELKGIKLAGLRRTARLTVTDDEGRSAVSNPIHCTEDESAVPKPRWGMIHGHTEFSDGAGTIEHYLSYMREGCRLDFGAPGDHDHAYETTDEMWGMTQDAVARHNEPGGFVTLLGYEWAKWRQNGDGDRNVYYADDHRPMYRSDEGHSPTPGDLYESLKDERAIIIPHHPANKGNHCDYKDYDPTKDRLVEIYSVWGSSELGIADGNPFPMRPWRDEPDRIDSGEVTEGFVQRALEIGWRVGFTAGGDDHNAHPGDMTPRTGKPPKSAGLMCVMAPELTRRAIWHAMYDRHCYGTTGARMLVEFAVNGAPMGSELFLDERPELAESRSLRVSVRGTDVVDKVEIIRNNEVVFTHHGQTMDETAGFEDEERLEDINLPASDHWPTPFTFYYARVTQADGEMAWTSPIWVSERNE